MQPSHLLALYAAQRAAAEHEAAAGVAAAAAIAIEESDKKGQLCKQLQSGTDKT